MGCRSTKPLNNSVSDDVGEKSIIKDLGSEYADDNGNMNSQRNMKPFNGGKTPNGKMFMQKDLKELGRKSARGNSKNAPYSQSQLDFFEMLDKKIMEGKDFRGSNEYVDEKHINTTYR
ncbi:uncharacterized protein [Clytia hemisphaerica]|uniref:Uncharacterized protein n=1 Tax=Clytia hemisphaerica TaxID=252671 RepID=A0A7M5X5W2_9CNID